MLTLRIKVSIIHCKYVYDVYREVKKMKNSGKKNKERKLNPKDFSMKNGKFLDEETIHGKGMNFLGNIFRT